MIYMFVNLVIMCLTWPQISSVKKFLELLNHRGAITHVIIYVFQVIETNITSRNNK